MFLYLPVIFTKGNTSYNREVAFNPTQIVTIEPDLEDGSECVLTTTNGFEYYIPLSMRQVERKIQTYLERSVFARIFKQKGSS